MKKNIIEFTGTFFLVLVIGMTGYQQSLFGSAQILAPLAIGGILAAMVYMGGSISGAHYNPAVTLGMMMRKKTQSGEAIKYMLFQLIGAIAGAAVIYILFKSPMNPPAPNVGFSNAVKPLLIEMIFTFAWVMVMLYTNASAKSSGNSYFGLAVGFVVMAGIVAAGPLSGACFNPAYALGSMIMDSVLGGTSIGNSWFYLMGQFAGGILAAVVHGMANPDEN